MSTRAEIQQLIKGLSPAEMQEALVLLDELEARAEIKKCQDNIIDFVLHLMPDYKLGPHLKTLYRLLTAIECGDKDRVIVNMAPRFGKLISDDTLIHTTEGLKKHGELKVGDYVFHPSGKPIKVLWVSEKGPAKIEMTFTNGQTIFCHENHEWTVNFRGDGSRYKTVETNYFFGIAKTGPNAGRQRKLMTEENKKKHRFSYRLPLVGTFYTENIDLPIDPYALGAWLGDGSKGKSCITHHPEDMDVIKEIEKRGYKISSVCTHSTTKVKTTYFCEAKHTPNASRLARELRQTSVFNNKHIPDIFFRAGTEQKVDLLAGLIDTDGTVDKYGRVIFCNTNKKLIDDVQRLIRSLGWYCYICVTEPSLSSSGTQGKQKIYHVGFNPKIAIPCKIKRKQASKAGTPRRTSIRSVSVNNLGKQGHCIQVDSPDGLYVVGEIGVTTHNSLAISTYFPAWYIGKNPTHKLIIASHTSDLAVDFLRKVRNIMQTEEYRTIFPNVAIAADAKAAGKWNTTQGGEAYAVGVGGALAGRGGNLVIVDDPFSEQDVINGNYSVFDKVYEWFTYGLRTRLMPQGRIAILHCMTGDTQVMLADKTYKLLRNIKPNDLIASYDNGIIRPARVVNWANQGVDNIYTMTLKSGIVLRANERHPFLVEINEVREWIKVKNLKKGMKLVAIQDALGPHEETHKRVFAKYATTESGDTKRNKGGYHRQSKKSITRALPHHVTGYLDLKLSKVFATLANAGLCTIRKTLTPLINLWVDMGNGSEKNAVKEVVINPHLQKLCATTTTVNIGETKNSNKAYRYTALNKEGAHTLRRGMELPQSNTTLYGKNSKASVLYVGQNLTQIIHRSLGETINWLWTIAMKVEKYEVYCATIATLYSKRESPEQYYYGPLSTLNVTLDELVSIEYTGVEDVYDIEVEETENFIANGIVSHNTRWSTKDLSARLLRDAKLKPDADQYEHFQFPAIMDESTDTERSLWPEQWPLEALLRTKATMPEFQWCAQYQQNPTSEGAGIVQKAWFKKWEKDTPPPINFIVQAIDAAVEEKKRSDFNAITTWGVWFNEEENRNSLILLNSLNFRAEFPKLKDVTRQEYSEWDPDSLIIEAKANGAPLIQELRKQGVPVQSFVPHRGTGDKTARLNYVADIIKDGLVWIPATKWADELVEQVNQFPAGDNDDLVDSMVLALFRFRQGGFLRLSNDYDDTDSENIIRARGPRRYY